MSTAPGSATAVARDARRGLVAEALRDLAEGARHWPQWFTLGNIEIRLRFRRTGLGPMWTTLSFALLAGVLSFVYSRILHAPIRDYAPYLALGLLVWMFIAVVIQEACDVFVHAAPVLKQVYIPRSVLLYRLMWRNAVLLGFNFTVAAAVLALCRVEPGRAALLAFPGLILLCANLFWLSFLLALLGARFWAVSRVIQASLPLAMLATPVIWRPARADLVALANWNPLYHAIELVRAPLLGAAPPPAVWIGALLACLLGGLAALAAFALVRRRLPYWL